MIISRSIGLIYPGDGETELRQVGVWARARGLTDTAFIFVTSHSDGSHALSSLEETANVDALSAAAADLASACTSVIWACTSGSFIHGFARAQQQASAIEKIVRAPTTSASLALARAAAFMGNEVEVLAAYDAKVSGLFVAFLQEAGVRVSAITCVGAASASDSKGLDLGREISSHQARYGSSRLPLLVPDTAIDTLSLVAPLEHRFACPPGYNRKSGLYLGWTETRRYENCPQPRWNAPFAPRAVLKGRA
jgi:maleate cis-trans isomerase